MKKAETEITVKVAENLNKIHEVLTAQGFKVMRNFSMTDHYYTGKENYLELPYPTLIANSFLLREIIDDKVKRLMVYKDKTIDENGNVISESKISSPIEDTENIRRILKAAGIEEWCIVKNDSTVYKRDDFEFAVQNIEDLGIFLEIEENESMTDMSSVEKFDYLINFANSLGLTLGDDYSCKKPYLKLLKTIKGER